MSTPLSTDNPTAVDFQDALHEVFGFSEFRALQEEAVRAAVAGQDVLMVMPTGAGKSLCFQLPAALSSAVTLVVSPLVALMRDQVEGLAQRTAFRHLGCAYINSLQSSDEQQTVLQLLRDGYLRLLYVAPERFRSAGFIETLRSVPIARFVVDEAHCISEWGHDFRPDYRTLQTVIESLGRPPITAVTATATRRVQQSIIENLGMREPATFIGGFNRPNLHFSVHRCKSESERQERLIRALPKLAAMGGSGLIYVGTRKQCEEIAVLAARALAPTGKKAGPYHAGMDAATRNLLQSQWLAGEVHTLVATTAFGMGIDKPDVRFVVHYVLPESLESYYQESGRAGRDGRKSRCVVLYQFMDRRLREFFIENEALAPEDVRQAHTRLCAHADQDPVRIPKSWWTQTFQWNEVKVRLALSELERAGLVDRIAENADATIIRILRRDFPADGVRRIAADLARQRDERYRRLDEIVAYCKTNRCRRRTILDYFGDLEDPDALGSCCDNCSQPVAAQSVMQADESVSPVTSRVAMPHDVEGRDIHALLQALDALHPKVGKRRLNQLLRASASQEVQGFKAADCPLYGALRGCSRAQVDEFLTNLVAAGLLHEGDEDEYFVCTVTAAGRAAWQEKRVLDIIVPGVPSRSATLENEDDGTLFESLRRWRRSLAIAENVPPYCILSDRTLLEIANQKPQKDDDLRGITGIGERKLEKYGAAILEIT
ncbi:MAG: ATP-dependent DNA helicase, partial [Armatimonadota bacterium]|nr:ATP-dependent DNA helicase [Armatimonadota bacterium]